MGFGHGATPVISANDQHLSGQRRNLHVVVVTSSAHQLDLSELRELSREGG
jgi:hypothetical protein